MRHFGKYGTNLARIVLAAGVAGSAAVAPAQIGISIGTPPPCPYGYYDFQPYNCAPYGYYGPEWFNGGMFIGAGPWYRGRHGFYGHVDNRYDPHHGYGGPFPDRGDRAFNGFHGDENRSFHGNEMRDGQGHVGGGGHGGGDHGGGHR